MIILKVCQSKYQDRQDEQIVICGKEGGNVTDLR